MCYCAILLCSCVQDISLRYLVWPSGTVGYVRLAIEGSEAYVVDFDAQHGKQPLVWIWVSTYEDPAKSAVSVRPDSFRDLLKAWHFSVDAPQWQALWFVSHGIPGHHNLTTMDVVWCCIAMPCTTVATIDAGLWTYSIYLEHFPDCLTHRSILYDACVQWRTKLLSCSLVSIRGLSPNEGRHPTDVHALMIWGKWHWTWHMKAN